MNLTDQTAEGEIHWQIFHLKNLVGKNTHDVTADFMYILGFSNSS